MNISASNADMAALTSSAFEDLPRTALIVDRACGVVAANRLARKRGFRASDDTESVTLATFFDGEISDFRRDVFHAASGGAAHWRLRDARAARRGRLGFDVSCLRGGSGPPAYFVLVQNRSSRLEHYFAKLNTDLRAANTAGARELRRSRLMRAKLVRTIEELEALRQAQDDLASPDARREALEDAIALSIAELKTLTTAGSMTTIAQSVSGAAPFQQREPKQFGLLIHRYCAALEKYLDQIAVAGPKPVEEMDMIAQVLGQHRAGPRDLLDIHVAALGIASASVPPVRAEAFSIEGRLLALEIMGLLVNYYRIRRLSWEEP